MFDLILITLAALQGIGRPKDIAGVPWNECQKPSVIEFCLAVETSNTTWSGQSSCLETRTCDTLVFANLRLEKNLINWFVITTISLPRNVDTKEITFALKKSKVITQNSSSDITRLPVEIRVTISSGNTSNTINTSNIFTFFRSEQFEASKVLWQYFELTSKSNMTIQTVSDEVYPSLVITHHFFNGSSKSLQTSMSKPVKLFSSNKNSTRLNELFRQGDKNNVGLGPFLITVIVIVGVVCLGFCCWFLCKNCSAGGHRRFHSDDGFHHNAFHHDSFGSNSGSL